MFLACHCDPISTRVRPDVATLPRLDTHGQTSSFVSRRVADDDNFPSAVAAGQKEAFHSSVKGGTGCFTSRSRRSAGRLVEHPVCSTRLQPCFGALRTSPLRLGESVFLRNTLYAPSLLGTLVFMEQPVYTSIIRCVCQR